METGIQVFKNPAFGEIRIMGSADKPMFCLADVCKALDLNNVSQVKTRLDQAGVISNEVGVITGTKSDGTPAIQNVRINFINEPNLYRCIFQSKKENATKFQDWVFNEVLPSIRKTGAYNIPKTYAEALRLAANQQDQIEIQKKLLEEQKPKVEFFDTVAESKTAIEMKEVANVLNFHKVGRNTLFQILRDNKLLTHKNQPYQRYIDYGFFRTVEQEWQRPNGDTNINIKTLVYQSGIDYIRKLLLKLGYKPNPKEYKENGLQDNNA